MVNHVFSLYTFVLLHIRGLLNNRLLPVFRASPAQAKDLLNLQLPQQELGVQLISFRDNNLGKQATQRLLLTQNSTMVTGVSDQCILLSHARALCLNSSSASFNNEHPISSPFNMLTSRGNSFRSPYDHLRRGMDRMHQSSILIHQELRFDQHELELRYVIYQE